jgi:hypothetical protein
MNFFCTALCFIGITFVSGLQIEILSGSIVPQLPALVYHGEGDCEWELVIKASGTKLMVTGSNGQRLPLENGLLGDLQATCVVNDTVLLNATISTTDTIPAPENVTLDTDGRLLQWKHIFQPSDLPPHFELVHGYNIAYLVHIYDRNDVGTGMSVDIPVGQNYLDLDDEAVVLNGCEEQEFVVQAVIGSRVSENSSSVSGNFSVVPIFIRLSAQLEVAVVENIIAIRLRVSFELVQEPCPGMNLSVFTVSLQGLGIFEFDVTSTHIENGRANFTLPQNISLSDICTMRGDIFGANDAGNSTTADIQLPSECGPSPSSRPTVTGPGIPSPTPPHTTLPPTISSPSPTGVPTILPAVLVPLVVVILLTIITSVFVIIIRRRNKDEPENDPENHVHTEDEEDQENRIVPVEVKTRRENYSDVIPCEKSDVKKRELNIPKTSYEMVDHLKTEEVRKQREAERAANPKSGPTPGEISIDPKDVGLSLDLHLELLLMVLAPVQAMWYSLGLSLRLSENFLDETDTNIETDGECLSDILKNWLQYHEPSMEGLNHALSEINQPPVAFDANRKEFVVMSKDDCVGEMEEDIPPPIPEKNL